MGQSTTARTRRGTGTKSAVATTGLVGEIGALAKRIDASAQAAEEVIAAGGAGDLEAPIKVRADRARAFAERAGASAADLEALEMLCALVPKAPTPGTDPGDNADTKTAPSPGRARPPGVPPKPAARDQSTLAGVLRDP